LLESALDKVPAPIMIADLRKQPRYANEPAANLFNVQEGWRERTQEAPSVDRLEGVVAELLDESLGNGSRLVSHFQGVAGAPDYRGAAFADVIRDWRQRTIGAVLHIQDLSYLRKVFAASRLIAEAEDLTSAMRSMLDAALLLGHQWGRLYIVDENNDRQLVSRLSFGFDDPPLAERFNQGGVVLSRDEEVGRIEWLCIDRKSPLVFCSKQELGDGEQYVTPDGLRAINVRARAPFVHAGIKPDDLWIDFPLTTQDKALGKLCLQCDDNLRPENFELLKILAETAGGLFAAFLHRDRDAGAREQMIRVSTAQTVMGVMAHNLLTRLGSLPVILARYRFQERAFGELKGLNDQFLHVIEESTAIVRRAKELLGKVVPQLVSLDLIAYLEEVLQSHLPPRAWTLQHPPGPIEVMIDGHLFETALLELMQNSKDAALNPEQMLITLTVELAESGGQQSGWVRIVYRDNGPGIPVEIRERVFEDFFSRRPGRQVGTGLGLGFVRRVVEAHDGFITAGSSQGAAEFVIAFPKARVNPSAGEVTHVSNSDR
jgi:signal transduction histidine kinase